MVSSGESAGSLECPSLVLIELDLSFSEVAVPMYSNSSV